MAVPLSPGRAGRAVLTLQSPFIMRASFSQAVLLFMAAEACLWH